MYSKEYLEQVEILKQYENCFEVIQPAKENDPEAFAWFSDLPHPLFNAVMHLSCSNVEEKIDQLIESAPKGNPMSFWLHSQNSAEGLKERLEERQFHLLTPCSLMSWEVKPIDRSLLDIRPSSLDIFNDISSQVYQFDEQLKERYGATLDRINSENYVLYVGPMAVGAGLLFPTGEIGGIFNVAVLPEYQGKGCAKAIMQFLMNRAYQLGLKKLILLSSPEAENLYLKLGFKKVLNVEIYSKS